MDDWLEPSPRSEPKARPVYETDKNQIREWQAIVRFGQRYSRRPVRLPKFYHVDYAMKEMDSPTLTSWVEVKCRENKRDAYPTLILSVHKVLAGVQLGEATRMPFVLFVEWTDYAGHVTIRDTSRLRVIVGGRYDRNDPQDVEPVFEIPIRKFNCFPLIKSEE